MNVVEYSGVLSDQVQTNNRDEVVMSDGRGGTVTVLELDASRVSSFHRPQFDVSGDRQRHYRVVDAGNERMITKVGDEWVTHGDRETCVT